MLQWHLDVSLPLSLAVWGADRHDSMLVEPIRDSLRPGQGCGPRPTPTAPGRIDGNKGYDNCRVPDLPARRRITARIARLGIDSGQRLGRQRWVVERTLGWLPCKRLALRSDRTAATITVLARDEHVASRGPTTCPGCDRTGRMASTGSIAVTDAAFGGSGRPLLPARGRGCCQAADHGARE